MDKLMNKLFDLYIKKDSPSQLIVGIKGIANKTINKNQLNFKCFK